MSESNDESTPGQHSITDAELPEDLQPTEDNPLAQPAGDDVLSTDWRAPKRGRAVDATADPGEVVEEVMTDFCGEIVAVDRDLHTVTLEDRRNRRRTFPLGPGFLIDGKPVELVAPTRAAAPARPTRTASGSVA